MLIVSHKLVNAAATHTVFFLNRTETAEYIRDFKRIPVTNSVCSRSQVSFVFTRANCVYIMNKNYVHLTTQNEVFRKYTNQSTQATWSHSVQFFL
jgi:leucyl-tRNA synthetase